MKVKMSKH